MAAASPQLVPPVSKPRLSVRTAAQFLTLPAVKQMKLLHDQKYPKQSPQVFKQPYYKIALNGITNLLASGQAGLFEARSQIQQIAQPARRMHCMRVLEQFVGSDHAKRGLTVATNKHYYAQLGDVELRLSPDLVAYEGDELRYIYFNLKAEQYNAETARMTTEIAHWLLDQNGVKVKPQQIEFIDLFTGVLYPGKPRRKRTILSLEENAKVIETLWPSIGP